MSGDSRTLQASLKEARARRGLTQEELARLCGLSRQSLNQIENGTSVPSTAIALRLSRALGCRVEELFALREPGELRATLAEPLGETQGPASKRAVVGQISGRFVAHALRPRTRARDLTLAADALIVGDAPGGEVASGGLDRASGHRGAANRAATSRQAALRAGAAARLPGARSRTVRLKPLGDPGRLSLNLLVAGCDPALGLLAERAARASFSARIVWLEAASGASLEALAREEVHLAGAHLFDEQARDYNVSFVQSACAGRAMVVVTVAQIEEGLAVARGNPKRIGKVEHLARRGVRIVNREPGAGARRLLDSLLAEARIPAAKIEGYGDHAPGHLEAAGAVARGGADAAMVTCSSALALGLDFIPLASERFDLALPKDSLSDPRVAGLLETLASSSFREELASIGGYQTRKSGSIAAELGG